MLCLFVLQDLTRDAGGALLDALSLVAKPFADVIFAATVHRTRDFSVERRNAKLDARLAPAGPEAPLRPQENWSVASLASALRARGHAVQDEIALAAGHPDFQELYLRSIAAASPAQRKAAEARPASFR